MTYKLDNCHCKYSHLWKKNIFDHNLKTEHFVLYHITNVRNKRHLGSNALAK